MPLVGLDRPCTRAQVDFGFIFCILLMHSCARVQISQVRAASLAFLQHFFPPEDFREMGVVG